MCSYNLRNPSDECKCGPHGQAARPRPKPVNPARRSTAPAGATTALHRRTRPAQRPNRSVGRSARQGPAASLAAARQRAAESADSRPQPGKISRPEAALRGASKLRFPGPRGCGGTGRRARLRALWASRPVEVRVLSAAPSMQRLNLRDWKRSWRFVRQLEVRDRDEAVEWWCIYPTSQIRSSWLLRRCSASRSKSSTVLVRIRV